jgi:hypothetical protein
MFELPPPSTPPGNTPFISVEIYRYLYRYLLIFIVIRHTMSHWYILVIYPVRLELSHLYRSEGSKNIPDQKKYITLVSKKIFPTEIYFNGG